METFCFPLSLIWIKTAQCQETNETFYSFIITKLSLLFSLFYQAESERYQIHSFVEQLLNIRVLTRYKESNKTLFSQYLSIHYIKPD